MTKEDWNYIKEQWACYGNINMKVDGYELTLELHRSGMKLMRAVFVDGVFKGADMVKDAEGKYSDRSDRFLKRKMKSVYSRKQINDFEKGCGKRAAKRHNIYVKFETRSPYWNSFGSFKKHILEHNTNIELIKD